MTDRCEWPLTHGNAPTHVENGVEVIEKDAALELANRYIVEHADLMEALKDR